MTFLSVIVSYAGILDLYEVIWRWDQMESGEDQMLDSLNDRLYP